MEIRDWQDGVSQRTVLVQALDQHDRTTVASVTANQKYQLNFFFKNQLSMTFRYTGITQHFHKISAVKYTLCFKAQYYPAPKVQIENKTVSAIPVEHCTNYCTCTKCCDDRHCSVCYDQDPSK